MSTKKPKKEMRIKGKAIIDGSSNYVMALGNYGKGEIEVALRLLRWKKPKVFSCEIIIKNN